MHRNRYKHTIASVLLLLCIAWADFLVAQTETLRPTILLTGGTGYIGSHVAVILMQNGYDVVLVDNLSNSDASVGSRIETVAGRSIKRFYPYDLKNVEQLDSVFKDTKIDGVIHLAGFKAVGESSRDPLAYYTNNLESTLALLEVMKRHKCYRLIFSSSATVYGDPKYLPIDENHPLGATNPYGRTKQMIEDILKDVSSAGTNHRFVSLRYFNPVGAHESGLIGENPNGVPQNLVPYMLQVVEGKRSILNIYGNDYPTSDGTGVRDYIHIADLADGHLLALNTMFGIHARKDSYRVYNLGTGKGFSVKQMIDALSQAVGYPIPYVITDRRPGDVAEVYADCSKATRELGFHAGRGLVQMMRDSLTRLRNSQTCGCSYANATGR